jgi:hypothetical protein
VTQAKPSIDPEVRQGTLPTLAGAMTMLSLSIGQPRRSRPPRGLKSPSVSFIQARRSLNPFIVSSLGIIVKPSPTSFHDSLISQSTAALHDMDKPASRRRMATTTIEDNYVDRRRLQALLTSEWPSDPCEIRVGFNLSQRDDFLLTDILTSGPKIIGW